MRIPTTLEVLRRGAAGQTVETIAAEMHIGKTTIRELLDKAGYPDAQKIGAYRTSYGSVSNRDVWATADTVATYAATIRINPDWVHTSTAELSHQELRTLFAVAVAMLDADVQPREALAWSETGATRGRPKKIPA